MGGRPYWGLLSLGRHVAVGDADQQLIRWDGALLPWLEGALPVLGLVPTCQGVWPQQPQSIVDLAGKDKQLSADGQDAHGQDAKWRF